MILSVQTRSRGQTKGAKHLSTKSIIFIIDNLVFTLSGAVLQSLVSKVSNDIVYMKRQFFGTKKKRNFFEVEDIYVLPLLPKITVLTFQAFQKVIIFPLTYTTEPLRHNENIFSFKVLNKYEPYLKAVS